jgi:iduronate 2-sulfatase
MKPKSTQTSLLFYIFVCFFIDAKLQGTEELQGTEVEGQKTRPNVLLLISDDANTSLGCYGHPIVQSPNIDRLAERGVRFDKAYCQFPLCIPSRISFLAGKRPDPHCPRPFLFPLTNAYEVLTNAVFLPQYFRDQGYYTVNIGKVFHPNPAGDNLERYSFCWDVIVPESGENKMPSKDQILTSKKYKSVQWASLKSSDEETADGKAGQAAVKYLKEATEKQKPFFIAVGFRRPHSPYTAPARYFDLYPPDKMVVPHEPADHLQAIPPVAFLNGFKKHKDDLLLSENEMRESIAAYYASISFMDTQLGKVLDQMDRLKLWENTIVVFLSDHGYHTGEHGGMWHKLSLFEESARVPLIIAAPKKKANVASSRLVELVDLYSTLVELCGLPISNDLEGTSMAPLLENPDLPWKKAAFTYTTRYSAQESGPTKVDHLGCSIRTERYRYVEWDGGKSGIQLYDHQTDPKEYINLAHESAHAKTVEEMKGILKRDWKNVQPPQ